MELRGGTWTIVFTDLVGSTEHRHAAALEHENGSAGAERYARAVLGGAG